MPDNVINKVVFEGRTLVDLTDTTATAETILSGYGAYGADGVWVDGTATAGSLSGHVWQDNEGYIHLDDDGGDMYITTPLNVTTNGTYTAPTGVAYTPVSVQVPQGTDLPVLTIHYDSNYEIDSVTCDKTFAECLALSKEDIIDALFEFDWDGSLQESTWAATGAYDSYYSLIKFNVADVNNPYCSYVVTYNSNNTLSVVAYNTKDSGNMTVSGATVTAEAGYYPYTSSKSVASGSATTPATTVTANPSISVNSSGLITATASATKSVTPTVSAGYVSSGTAGTITVSGSNTSQLTTQAAQTIHPSSSDQTINSGKYLTGAQTIKGVTTTNLSAENIKSGVTVEIGDSTDSDCVASVTGTYEGGGGSTTHTAYIIRNKSDTRPSVQYGSTIYRTDGETFTFTAGDTLVCSLRGEMSDGSLIVDGVNVSGGSVSYTYTLPNSDITINLSDVGSGTIDLTTLTSDFGKVDEKQINFITYDGTILYSYTAAEWANVTSLPSSPYYENLLSEGWNWTKPLIDAQLSAVPDGVIWVGQIFMPLSRCTEIDVEMTSPRLSPSMNISVNGTATIDWGDNTTPDTITGTSLTTNLAPTHTYASGGRYTIKISRNTAATAFQFYGSTNIALLYNSGTNVNRSLVYSNCIKAIRIGVGFNGVSAYSFAYCLSLEYITFPWGTYGTASHVCEQCNSLKSYISLSGIISEYSFNTCYSLKNISTSFYVAQFATNSIRYCYSLRSVTVSKYCTLLMNAAFQNCNALAKIALPEGITTINASAFNGCKSLASITIPSTVTSIGNYAFMNCYGLAEIHVLPTTPPTLGTSVLSGSTEDVVIYVPYSNDHSVLEAYHTAWSTYASYIVEESP